MAFYQPQSMSRGYRPAPQSGQPGPSSFGGDAPSGYGGNFGAYAPHSNAIQGGTSIAAPDSFGADQPTQSEVGTSATQQGLGAGFGARRPQMRGYRPAQTF